MQSYARRAALINIFACIVCPALLTFHVVAEPAVVAEAAQAAGKDMAHDPELSEFNTIVDLRELAFSYGFFVDPKASWRGTTVMRTDTDKIAISRNASDGRWLWYSFRRARGGSVVEFVQDQKGLNLGQARVELRRWLGRPATSRTQFPALETKPTKDLARVHAAFAKTTVAHRHAYLEQARGIPSEILTSPRFIGTVRDSYGRACFPHTDENGVVTGWEIRGADFKGFCAHGWKSLYRSNAFTEDMRLVFCESGVDVLSLAAVRPDSSTRYASIAGTLNLKTQPELIRLAAAAMPQGSHVVAAMDADDAGARLADAVERAVRSTGRTDLHFEISAPPAGDWNDQLRASRGAASPIRHEEPHVG